MAEKAVRDKLKEVAARVGADIYHASGGDILERGFARILPERQKGRPVYRKPQRKAQARGSSRGR